MADATTAFLNQNKSVAVFQPARSRYSYIYDFMGLVVYVSQLLRYRIVILEFTEVTMIFFRLSVRFQLSQFYYKNLQFVKIVIFKFLFLIFSIPL